MYETMIMIGYLSAGIIMGISLGYKIAIKKLLGNKNVEQKY